MLYPAGIPVSFSAVFEDAVASRVALSVWDISTNTPSEIQAPTLMTPLESGSDIYVGKFTPDQLKNYAVVMAVYTDNTFSALDPTFLPISEAVTSMYLSPPVQNVVGVVNCSGGN